MGSIGVEVLFDEGAQLGRGLSVFSFDGHRTDVLLSAPSPRTYRRSPDLSPDGRWVAYESNESGRLEVYVGPFPRAGDGRWRVSTDGGSWAVWGHGGGELFFLDRSFTLTVVPVEGRGSTFTAGKPTKLFDNRDYFTRLGDRTYDVSHDGQRSLMIKDQ